jgi:hypothetical protein
MYCWSWLVGWLVSYLGSSSGYIALNGGMLTKRIGEDKEVIMACCQVPSRNLLGKTEGNHKT